MEGKQKNGFDGHMPLRPQPTPRLRLVGDEPEQATTTPVVAGGQGRGDWQPQTPAQQNNEVGMPTIVAALVVAALFGALVTWMVMR
jgi:hypothetical protein